MSEIQSQGEATRQKRQPRAIQRQTPMMQVWSRQGWGGVGLETGGRVLEQGGMGMPGGSLQRQRQEGMAPWPQPTPPHPQVQEVQPITSYDAAGSFLLLGCNNGSIYYVGEQQLALQLPENLP